jgi:hypothetical protein
MRISESDGSIDNLAITSQNILIARLLQGYCGSIEIRGITIEGEYSVM